MGFMRLTGLVMTTEERDSIFLLVLDEMPKKFSSTEFCGLAKDLGIDEKTIHHGLAASFLHKHTHKIKGTRTWVKTDAHTKKRVMQLSKEGKTYREISAKTGVGMGSIHNIKTEMPACDENSCIECLKAKGYKVLKPKWEEL